VGRRKSSFVLPDIASMCAASCRSLRRWILDIECAIRHAEVAKAMDYLLKRWGTFTRFLADGGICLSNNTAESAVYYDRSTVY
jgi:Transposase IS66 family